MFNRRGFLSRVLEVLPFTKLNGVNVSRIKYRWFWGDPKISWLMLKGEKIINLNARGRFKGVPFTRCR